MISRSKTKSKSYDLKVISESWAVGSRSGGWEVGRSALAVRLLSAWLRGGRGGREAREASAARVASMPKGSNDNVDFEGLLKAIDERIMACKKKMRKIDWTWASYLKERRSQAEYYTSCARLII